MKSVIGAKRKLVSVIHALLLLLSLGVIASWTDVTYADAGNVTVNKSYRGTWEYGGGISSSWNIDYPCPKSTNESALKACFDAVIAALPLDIFNNHGLTLYQSWGPEIYARALNPSDPGQCNLHALLECDVEEWQEDPELGGSIDGIEISMYCPNDGSPTPTLGDNQGAGPIQGWCIVLGVAPPPAAPTCADGSSLPEGQVNCASPAEAGAGNPADCQCGGDPINIGSGNVYLEVTDFKTTGQFPLEFKRSYNSNIANQVSSPDGADSSMGAGWTTNVTGSHLYINVNQQFFTCTDQDNVDYICPTTASPVLVTVWHQDGSQSVFSGQVSSSGSTIGDLLIPQPGATGQLSYVALPAPLLGNGYKYLDSRGSAEYYSDVGALLMIQNPHGGQLLYSYNSSGQIVTVIDTSMAIGSDNEFLVLDIAYDELGRIKTVTNTTGNQNDGPSRTYVYDSYGNLSTVTYPDNTAIHYLYEDSAYPHALTGTIDEDSNRYSSWGYDAQGRAITSQLAGGADEFVVNHYTLDSQGNITGVLVTEPTGLQRTLAFATIDGKILLTSTSSPCTECNDKSRYLSYDSNGFVTSKTDFDGNTTEYTRDSAGRELTKIEAAGTSVQRTTTTTWNDALNLPETVIVSNAAGQPLLDVANCYNAGASCVDAQGSGLVWTTTVTDLLTSVSRTTTYKYTNYISGAGPIGFPRGLLISIVGPRTDALQQTTLGYFYIGSAMPGVCYTVRQAGNAMKSCIRDFAGSLLSFFDENDQPTYFTYDARQRHTSTKRYNTISSDCQPSSTCNIQQELTQYNYDPAGNLIKLIKPSGGYIQYGYDAARRLTSITDSAGQKIVYTLDALGNRVNEQTYGSNGIQVRSHQRVYDNLNHLVQDIGGMGQTTNYGYDPNGNVISITDPRSHSATRTYDALGRLASNTDASGGITRFTTDTFDRTIKVVDPRGLETDYARDAFGDIVELDSPDTGTTTYTYDLAGNRVSQTNSRGDVANYTYDAIDRLTSIAYPQNSTRNVTYGYDQGDCGRYTSLQRGQGYIQIQGGIGHLICMIDRSGTTAYPLYDGYGNRLLDVGPVKAASYIYDADNNVSKISYPSGTYANGVIYQRDGLDRITEVDAQYIDPTTAQAVTYALAKNIVYEPFGPISSLKYGNNLVETRTFDSDYRLTGISIPAVMGLGYTYDADNNIVSMSDSIATAGKSFAQTLGYDSVDRLSAANGSYGNFTYTYDGDGNMLTKTTVSTGKVRTYAYPQTSNQLTTNAGSGGGVISYTYNASGELTSDGTYTYTNDLSDRLTSVSSAGTSVGSYVYNGLGQRAEKVAGASTSYFIYDMSGHLLSELNGSGVPRETMVWLGDRLIANFGGSISDKSSARYIHVDQLNTPRVMTDSAKTIGWVWYSDPFGNGTPTAINFGSSFNLRLPGQYYDSETGNEYNYYRYYDPGTGRYMESDPIGLAGGINTYIYVNDNPLRFVDPYGLCGQKPQGQDTAGSQPESDDQKHADCIRSYLTAHEKLDLVNDEAFAGPNGQFNQNVAIWTIIGLHAVKDLGEAAVGAESGPADAIVIAHGIYDVGKGAYAGLIYKLAENFCTP